MKRWVAVVVLTAMVASVIAVLLSTTSGDDTQDPSKRPTPAVTSGLSASPDPFPTATQPTAPSPDGQTSQAEGPWDGPDQAVSTRNSKTCGRVVLMFGAQEYSPGGLVEEVPQGVEYLGYHRDVRQLWGDRGAPTTLYITSDGGKTFQEWFATDAGC